MFWSGNVVAMLTTLDKKNRPDGCIFDDVFSPRKKWQVSARGWGGSLSTACLYGDGIPRKVPGGRRSQYGKENGIYQSELLV